MTNETNPYKYGLPISEIVRPVSLVEIEFWNKMDDFNKRIPNGFKRMIEKHGDLLPCPFCNGRFLTLEPGSHSCRANR